MSKRILFIDADRELREVFASYTGQPEIREAFGDWCAEAKLFPMNDGGLDRVCALYIGFAAGYRACRAVRS